MRKVTAQLADELDREPTDEEIAYAMDMPVNKIAHLKSVGVRPSSLDAPVGEDGDTTFGELVGDENEATPLENLQEKSAAMTSNPSLPSSSHANQKSSNCDSG